MGIHQLTSFVESHHPFLFKEQYYVDGKSLVFDGNALLYALLKMTKLQYGGNYNELYHIFKSYFGKLISLKVKPYVILDGGHNLQEKLGTIINRKYNQIAALRKINHPQKARTVSSTLLKMNLADNSISKLCAGRATKTQK